jgi:protein-L-isoaspartate(D-aspartate) O-methyltransferase
MTATTTPADQRRLVDTLTAAGSLTDPAWIAAFSQVPRGQFTPVFWQRLPGGIGAKEFLDGSDPATADHWAEVVYSDHALVTHHDADGTATSSSTQPSLMSLMLHALDIHDGNRVLEIGTGTGYNAALLCHRLGDANVTSIDVNPELVTRARAALETLGYAPRLALGDGTRGVPEAAPYDRVIATCSTNRVPAAWITQTRPCGIILANIGAGVVRLQVAEDGQSASGQFLPGFAGFIEARAADGPVRLPLVDLMTLCTGSGASRPAQVGTDFDDHELLVFLNVSIPDLTRNTIAYDDSDLRRYLFADPSRSWTVATHHPAGRDEVTVAGPHDLWADLDTVRGRWIDAGRPHHKRLGLTVTADGTHILWVDQPDSGHAWPIAGPSDNA